MQLDKFQLRQMFELCRCGPNEGIVAKAEMSQFGEGPNLSRQRALGMEVESAKVGKRQKINCTKH